MGPNNLSTSSKSLLVVDLVNACDKERNLVPPMFLYNKKVKMDCPLGYQRHEILSRTLWMDSNICPQVLNLFWMSVWSLHVTKKRKLVPDVSIQ